MIPVFHGKMVKRCFVCDDQYLFNQFNDALDGKRVDVTIRKERSIRSLNENNYYWGVVLQLLSEHTGYTTDEMHEICKHQFLMVHGQFDYVKSTTKLNTVEFEEYLDKIKNWAAVLGVNVPNPNECEA